MLYITEYQSLAVDSQGRAVPAPYAPGVAEQAIEIMPLPTRSETFDSRTRFVMIHASEAACLAFNADAVEGRHRIAAGETRTYGVQTGGWVSAIGSD